jgi:hypothetical protein
LKNQERKTWKINFDDYFVEKVQQVSFIWFFLFCLRPGPFNLCLEILLCGPSSIKKFFGILGVLTSVFFARKWSKMAMLLRESFSCSTGTDLGSTSLFWGVKSKKSALIFWGIFSQLFVRIPCHFSGKGTGIVAPWLDKE